MSILLECSRLTKRFGKREVLKQIDLRLESGHIIGFLGPNGSGKTTMIKIMNGLLTPTEGEIRFCGGSIGAESKKQKAYFLSARPDLSEYESEGQRCDWIFQGLL